jgi:hypothetical protein
VRNIETREGFEFTDKLNALPRYAFALSPSGNSIHKLEDKATGNWIDVHEVQTIIDQAQDEINQYRAERDALQRRLPSADEQIDTLAHLGTTPLIAARVVESYDAVLPGLDPESKCAYLPNTEVAAFRTPQARQLTQPEPVTTLLDYGSLDAAQRLAVCRGEPVSISESTSSHSGSGPLANDNLQPETTV